MQINHSNQPIIQTSLYIYIYLGAQTVPHRSAWSYIINKPVPWSAGVGIGPLIQVSNAWSQCQGPQVTSRSSGPGPGQRGSSGTGAGPGYLGLGLQIRIRRGASPAPEFVSICFETRRKRWLLDSTRFDSFPLFSTRLDSTLFDSTRFDSFRLDSIFSTRFDSFRFDSTRSTQSHDLPQFS